MAKLIASLVVTISMMTIIFLLSAQSSADSGSLSDAVARMLASLLLADFNSLDAVQQLEIIRQWSWPVRKTAHATEYACLAISLCCTCWQMHAYRQEQAGENSYHRPSSLTRICGIGFVLTVLYSCTDELHQLFIDGRAGQFADVLVDASGALAGCLLCFAIFICFFRSKANDA